MCNGVFTKECPPPGAIRAGCAPSLGTPPTPTPDPRDPPLQSSQSPGLVPIKYSSWNARISKILPGNIPMARTLAFWPSWLNSQ